MSNKKNKLKQKTISIIALILFSLVLVTSIYAATSIELTTSDWINFLGVNIIIKKVENAHRN